MLLYNYTRGDYMSGKMKPVVICFGVLILAAVVAIAVISVSRGSNEDPENDPSGFSSSDPAVPSSEKAMLSPPGYLEESGAGQNSVPQKSEVSTADFEKTVNAAACFYYMSFDSGESLSDQNCIDAVQAMIIEQDAHGDQRFVPVTKDGFVNLADVNTVKEIVFELFGKSDVSDPAKLSSDGSHYEFMFAGGVGAPTATVKSAEQISDKTFKLLVSFYEQNGAGEVIVSQSAYLTLEKIDGKYFDFRILGFNNLDG